MAGKSQYSIEFKTQAVKRVIEDGLSAAQVARELGINHKVVENVMKEPGIISKFTTFGYAKSQLLCNCPHLSLRLIISRKYKATTNSKHDLPVAPNV